MVKLAERRMFAKTIIDSDAFIDMPLSTQALYFHLSMRADDDGFVNNPKKIQRMVGCNDDDIKVLLSKKFIIGFESGIVVIKHWKLHNYIQKDRYKETVYLKEKAQLESKENNSYKLMDTKCIQDVDTGKDRLVKSKVSIYHLLEQNFGRPISPLEYEKLNSWNNEELVKYAIEEAVLNNAKNIKYVEAILLNLKNDGITTYEQAKKRTKKKKETKTPEWFDKDLSKPKIEYTEEERKMYAEIIGSDWETQTNNN